jgi:MFS family permease
VSDAEQRIAPYSWYALILLTSVYVLNFLDRTLIYILFTPIKKEMHFSDLQLSLLGATSFAIFYTLLGIPFGRIADRTSRKNMIATGLAIWSLFSGLTGFAGSFWAIFFCRLMVGVGEATLGPAAFSLIADYFPPSKRATVQGIYSAGIPLGSGLASFLGGWIGQTYGWRWAFYLLGFPGLVLAVLVFLLRERPRGSTETAATVSNAGTDWRALFRSRKLMLLYAGFALFALASNNLSIWGPTFYSRIHDVSLQTFGRVAGIISILVGIPATVFGGFYADRMSQKLKGGRLEFCALAAAVSVPLWLGVLFIDNMPLLIVVNSIVFGLMLMWLGPGTAETVSIAGPQLRGLAIGIFFSLVNITAYGIGSPLIGRLSDAYGLRLALLVCPIVCGLGAVTLWAASRAPAAARP